MRDAAQLHAISVYHPRPSPSGTTSDFRLRQSGETRGAAAANDPQISVA